jgi:hypothetical protein
LPNAALCIKITPSSEIVPRLPTTQGACCNKRARTPADRNRIAVPVQRLAHAAVTNMARANPSVERRLALRRIWATREAKYMQVEVHPRAVPAR